MKPWRSLAIILSLSTLAGCSLYRNDRAYIWDSQYQMIRDLYERSGSVAVVEEVLRNRQWTGAQINDVRYRLAQDFSLDENGNPRVIDRERPIMGTQTAIRLGLGSRRGMAPTPMGYY